MVWVISRGKDHDVPDRQAVPAQGPGDLEGGGAGAVAAEAAVVARPVAAVAGAAGDDEPAGLGETAEPHAVAKMSARKAAYQLGLVPNRRGDTPRSVVRESEREECDPDLLIRIVGGMEDEVLALTLLTDRAVPYKARMVFDLPDRFGDGRGRRSGRNQSRVPG